MKYIYLDTEEKTKIYLKPTRQNILKIMREQGSPMTVKEISNILNISASSVTYHLEKLKKLNIINLSHTKIINGITAKYYELEPYTISLSSNKSDTSSKLSYIDSSINEIYNNTKTNLLKNQNLYSDINFGIVHLTHEEIIELNNIIQNFVISKKDRKENTSPYEFALIYNKIDKGEKNNE